MRLVPRLAACSLLLFAGLLLARPAPASAGAAGSAGEPWRPPVEGAVLAGFTWSARAPYAAGRRRGIDLRAPAGTRVRAACTGRVAFAGRVPWGRRGVTTVAVSVRCGPRTATHLPLRSAAVRRGRPVVRGGPIGIAAGPALRLGARQGAGWVDPLALLGRPAAWPPGAAPLGRAPRPAAPRGAPRRPGGRPFPVPARPVAARRALPASGLPPLALAGVALTAAGLGAGGVLRARRRRAPALLGRPGTAAARR